MQLISSSSRNIFVLSIYSFVIAGVAHCVDFSSDFDIDQNFLNEMKQNFGENNQVVKQDPIKQDIKVNHPEELSKPSMGKDKLTHNINIEKKSGLEKINSSQIANIQQSPIKVALPEVPESIQKHQQPYSAKEVIDQFKALQSNTNISSTIKSNKEVSVGKAIEQKGIVDRVSNSLQSEKPVTLSTPPLSVINQQASDIKVAPSKSATLPTLQIPTVDLETNRNSIDSKDVKDTLPVFPAPVMDQQSASAGVVTTSKDDTVVLPTLEIPKNQNVSALATPVVPVNTKDKLKSNAIVPKSSGSSAVASKESAIPQNVATIPAPINTQVDINKSAANVNVKDINAPTNVSTTEINSQQKTVLDNKTKVKKNTKGVKAALVSTKKNREFKLPNQKEQNAIEKKAVKTKVQEKVKCIPRPKRSLLVKNPSLTNKKIDKGINQGSTPLNPISVEEADKLGLKPRSVYDYRNQYLPSAINKKEKEYFLDNQHIPKAFFHSEYSKLLFTAVLQDDIGAIKELLKRGADINTINPTSGYTPLMQAVIRRKIDVARYLITRGADFNQQTADGKTALHFAAIVNDAEMFKMLIAAGSNTYITDIEDKTALQYITSSKMAAQIALYYDNMNEALLSCSDLGILGCVKFAIEKGADIDTIDKNHNTALMTAARNGYGQIVNWLLYKGAKSRKVNIKGETAAFIATRSGYRELAEIIETMAIKEEIIGYNSEEVIITDASDQMTSTNTNIGMKPIIRKQKKSNPAKPKKLTIRRYCD